MVTKLHELYCVHRERGKDEASEEELIAKEEEYISEIELKAHTGMDLHAKYERSVARNGKAKSELLKLEVAQQVKAETDADKLRKLNAEILKNEKEESKNKGN